MSARNRIACSTLLLIPALFLAGCEGFKILSVHNTSGQEIVIQTRPELPTFKHTSFADSAAKLADSKEYRIPPDSSLTLLATFGPLLFHAKIMEADLPVDYLKIITARDTITANSRAEILHLAKEERTKQKRKSSRNIKAIIVR